MSRYIGSPSFSDSIYGQEILFRMYLDNQENNYSNQSLPSSIKSNSAQIVNAIGLSTGMVSATIANCSMSQIKALEKSTELIVGSLNSGFNQLSEVFQKGFYEMNSNLLQIKEELWELNSKIDNLAGLIDMRMTALIEQQKLSNQKLQQILEFAKIPDFQKERIYYLENGLKYLKNAQTEPKRYIDALENLKEAEKREKRDYLTLYNIGLIYLFSSKLLDISAAEDYFLRAADYVEDEIPEGSSKSMNYIGEAKQNSADFIKNIAAHSFQFASYAQYLGNKFEDSIANSTHALSIDPNLKECYYNNVLAYLALKNEDKAMENLKSISNDHNYIIDAAFNPNIAVSEKVQEFLVNLRDSKKEQLTKKLNSVLSITKSGSPVYEKSKGLLAMLKEDTLLNILNVSKKVM